MTRSGSHSDPSTGASSVQLRWQLRPERCRGERALSGELCRAPRPTCSARRPRSVDHSQPQRYTGATPSAAPASSFHLRQSPQGPITLGRCSTTPATQEGPISAIPQPPALPNRWAAAKCSFWCHFQLLRITSMKRMPLLRCPSILWSLPHGITGLQ